MIERRFLKPFEGKVICGHLSKNVAINFLKTLSDDELNLIGNSLYWLFPKYPIDYIVKFANKRREGVDYTFVDDFRNTYNLSDKYTTKDKIIGKRLVAELQKNPNLTATEYIEMMGL